MRRAAGWVRRSMKSRDSRSEERRVGKEGRTGGGPAASSRRRHTRCGRDWSSDVCSSDLDHGMAIMSVRENLSFDAPIVSDSAPLHEMIAMLLDEVPEVRVMRDATRGGLGTTLNEIARQ